MDSDCVSADAAVGSSTLARWSCEGGAAIRGWHPCMTNEGSGVDWLPDGAGDQSDTHVHLLAQVSTYAKFIILFYSCNIITFISFLNC